MWCRTGFRTSRPSAGGRAGTPPPPTRSSPALPPDAEPVGTGGGAGVKDVGQRDVRDQRHRLYTERPRRTAPNDVTSHLRIM